jgi:hypothetical protein
VHSNTAGQTNTATQVEVAIRMSSVRLSGSGADLVALR